MNLYLIFKGLGKGKGSEKQEAGKKHSWRGWGRGAKKRKRGGTRAGLGYIIS
jgi:hypothetical protein